MKASNELKTFLSFALKVIIAHTLTYFIFGMIMSNLFDYGEIFRREIIRDFMLPIDDHNILLGPFMQPVRGLIFALGLWPLRNLLIEKKRGWLVLWGLLVSIGILSTPAAAPCSIEGILYTKLPLWYHLIGLPEILLQTLTFSIWLVWWERQSLKSKEPSTKKENPLLAEIIKSVMTACFAYIGYAIGGLLLVGITSAASGGAESVDIEAAGGDLKMQFMFVIAFLVNVIAVFWIARKWMLGQIALWLIFVIFWLVDSFVPWLYQIIVYGSSSIPMVFLLGLFPALIITLSIRLNYKRTAPQE